MKYDDSIDRYEVLHEDNNQITIEFTRLYQQAEKFWQNHIEISCTKVFANHMRGPQKYKSIQTQSQSANELGKIASFIVTFNKLHR